MSLRTSIAFLSMAASAVACSAEGVGDDATSAGSAALSSASVATQVVAIARGLTGEQGPFEDKAYYLSGTEPSGSRCIVTLSRDDAAYVGATIYTVGSNPPSDMGFSLYRSNPVSTPRVTVTSTASSLQASVAGKNASGGASSNNVEAHFGGSGGLQGLESIHIFTDNQLSSTKTEHVEATCSHLRPLVTVDRVADGPTLSRRARAFYEQQHGTTLASPVDLLGCGFGDGTDRIVYNFDSGLGNDDHDVPPDQLEVTFSVASQKIGAALSATLNGE
jgi:hypothetical protein